MQLNMDKGSWLLLHNIVKLHHPLNVKCFLTNHGIIEINNPVYSPVLSPPDFYLLPKFKAALKGHRFQDIPGVPLFCRLADFCFFTFALDCKIIPLFLSKDANFYGLPIVTMENYKKFQFSSDCRK